MKTASTPDYPLVLISVGDDGRRQELCKILSSNKLLIRDQQNSPTYVDLGGPVDDSVGVADLSSEDLAVHPPDIVVWEMPTDGQAEDLDDKQTWAPGTKILCVRPEESVAEIARSVVNFATRCWWAELCNLEVPACQVSPRGRILRANPAMRRRFPKKGVHGPLLRMELEGATEPELPSLHPLNRAIITKSCCSDFVETPYGQLQYVCLPDLTGETDQVRSVTVIMPDTGNRAQVFRFARDTEPQNLEQIHAYLVNCAVNLGFRRARLYRFFPDSNVLCGVASRGFRDKLRERDFATSFRLPIEQDEPSRDLLRYRIPALCIHDPEGKHTDKRSEIVRVYDKAERNCVEELELEGANRWIEAPLIVPGSDEIIGKLVVDNGSDSDSLTIRDSLDIGYLAMMGAGAIHANYDSQKNLFLKHFFKVLPRLVFEKEEKKFYRAIAAILSCEYGLRWEKVVLFITDSSGLKQAKCRMAIGGIDQKSRQELRHVAWDLTHYIDDALSNPDPQGDALYNAVVVNKSDLSVISFGQDESDSSIADLFDQVPHSGWKQIDVEENSWCREVNKRHPGTFPQPRLFAFPLTKSFAYDVELSHRSMPDQPVGVVLVGMESEGRHPESQDLLFTRAMLDVIGTLIAQRWTNQRITGMLGAFTGLFHPKLKPTWDELREAIENFLRKQDEDTLAELMDGIEKHQTNVDQIAVAQATFSNVSRSFENCTSLGEFVEEERQKWLTEWGKENGKGPLRVIAEVPDDLLIPCNSLVLDDVLTCLVQNAVEAAGRAAEWFDSITVTIAARHISKPLPGAEIIVYDDGPGVEERIEGSLFVQGISGEPEGGTENTTGNKGKGLALARAELLMYSGDLQYLRAYNEQGAAFRIVFHGKQQHEFVYDAQDQRVDRRQ